MTVDPNYGVKVSPVVRDDEGSVLLRQLAGVSMRLPTDPELVPAPEAVAWHADHVFRARATARLL